MMHNGFVARRCHLTVSQARINLTNLDVELKVIRAIL